MKHNRLNLFLVIVALVVSTTAIAQSDNYWSWNFNTHSALLAGSVVGGGAGSSAIYYNPALIDHENVPSLSLSANIMSLQFFNVDNIAGDGIDANRILFKVQPKFLSYVLPHKNDRLGIEVAILSPISEEIKFTIQHIDSLDLINRTQGVETYTGYLNYKRKYDDTWAGAGFSYRISDRFYVGGSTFLSVKVLNYESRQFALAYQERDSVIINEIMEPMYIAQSSFEEELRYWYLSFILKAGLQYKSGNNRINLGLNVTFPDIPLYGEAHVRKTINRSNVYNDVVNNFTANENTIGVEEKLKTVKVKNPFSIALGAQYHSENRKNSITFSLEYFHQIDLYPVVKSSFQSGWLPDYISDNITDDDFMSYYFEAGPVTNFALGFKQYISSSLTFLGGFRTDFTNSDIEDARYVENKFSINQVHMNKYHITSGLVLKIKNFKVVSGIQYTLGRNNDMTQAVNYSDPFEYNPITHQALEGTKQNNAQASIDEIALFLGLSVDL